MISAKYSLIRFVPDPVRNEPLNVGVLIWSGENYKLTIDEGAGRRFGRESGEIRRDLKELDAALREWIGSGDRFDEAQWAQIAHKYSGIPLLIGEPRFTTLSSEASAALDDELQSLMARLVHPPQQEKADRLARSADAALRESDVAQVLMPFVEAHRAYAHYRFTVSRSGTPRDVAYFVNGGANVAVDELLLAQRRSDESLLRVDAEAFKIEDIGAANRDVTFLVYCHLPEGKKRTNLASDARRVIESVGGTLVTERQELESELNRLTEAT